MFHGLKEKLIRFLRCMFRRLNTKRKYTYKNYPYVYEIKLKSDEKTSHEAMSNVTLVRS